MTRVLSSSSLFSATVLKKLEFDKVLTRISRLAVSEAGKERVLQILPTTDREEIREEHQRVSEGKELLIAEGSVPLDGLKDVRIALKKTSVENQLLSIQELLDVASTLRTSRTVHGFLAKRRSQYPSLSSFIPQLYSDKVVEFNITQAIDEQGFVKDSATKELRQIRRSLIEAGDSLRKRLNSILKQVSKQELLQDEIVTTREGRLVIPVKVEYKNQVPGFIHSSSATGATVYIEPAESLQLNNELRELQLHEQREIARILGDLTGQVREIRGSVEESFEALTVLDVVVAKARYSIEVIGCPPELSESPRIKLVEARHPVLLQRHERREVIPLTLELGTEAQTLVITGPNAGGKTVAMKTVGLLCLCAQAGIHIPSGSESEVYPFAQYFVDIGDDQSIEDDLSTFSSHLVKLKEVLTEADERSLVLIDEIGAGTDPAEGGSLAATVLKELTDRKVLTIATTHHGILKVFAHQTAGVENGSMEFDQASLRPTYRFRMGVPGSSFAFELAERIGISREVLAAARAELGDEKTKLESLIVHLERQSQHSAEQLKEVATERRRLEDLVRSYEEKMLELKKELSSIRKKAVEEARELVRDARAKIEQSVKEIRERGSNAEVVRSARSTVRNLSEQLRVPTSEVSPEELETLSVGDVVRLKDGHQVGEIVELQQTTATVLWGNAKLKVSRGSLVKALQHALSQAAPASAELLLESGNEIDLRGMLGDEAVTAVERFLDNAYVAGLHRVDIIHGKGTGALRKRITEFLKTYPHVKAFRLGEWNEGGVGVTVVEFS